MTELYGLSENTLGNSSILGEIRTILRRLIITNVEYTQNNSEETTINFHIIPFKNKKKNNHVSHLPNYYKYKKSGCDKENNNCAVCLNELKEGEYVRKLPKCSHLFHKKCIDKWFKKDEKKMSCPICRHKYGVSFYKKN